MSFEGNLFFLSEVHTTRDVDSEDLLNVQNVGDLYCLFQYPCLLLQYQDFLIKTQLFSPTPKNCKESIQIS